MTKDDVKMKVERLIGREVTINDKIKHSSPQLFEYAGRSGILKGYDLGEDYEDIFVNVEVVLKVKGKKSEYTTKNEVWMNAFDIEGIESK